MIIEKVELLKILDDIYNNFKFTNTIFFKEDSDLQAKYNALKQLNDEYPNNRSLYNELFIVKKGLDGENEIAYQLKKAHIGMYVLRDIKFKYEDMTAQIDFIVFTPVYTYYIECKNLIGNITVTDKGDFIREFVVDGKKIKKGMYSPLRQVEAQREVIRKMWENNTSSINKLLGSKKFDYYRRVLVVAANSDTILNTDKAPKDIKNKILRSDSLVRKINYDLSQVGNDEIFESRKTLEKKAQSYVDLSLKENIDYYDYYKKKYCSSLVESTNDDLKDRLISFRKKRSKELGVPAYYVFTDKELDRLVEIRPKSIEELRTTNILPPIKIKTHGEQIINEINN